MPRGSVVGVLVAALGRRGVGLPHAQALLGALTLVPAAVEIAPPSGGWQSRQSGFRFRIRLSVESPLTVFARVRIERKPLWNGASPRRAGSMTRIPGRDVECHDVAD